MYDVELSKLLVELSELTYVQYENDGKISLPPGFLQIASFKAPEIDIKAKWPLYSKLDWQDVISIREVIAIEKPFKDVYFGYAATSSKYNVIALRGTKSNFEWIMDAAIPQVPVPLFWYSNEGFKQAKVHLGFLIFYVFLVEQIIEACNQFNNELPCLVTGHSLGAALATLVAPTIKILTGNSNVQMYNYASPRVGNPAFVDAYNFLISESYRVINLSDLVPMIPPSKKFPWAYAHVKAEWSFLNQTGNVAGNHALIGVDNYRDAVNKETPTNVERKYPVTGF